MENKNSIFLGKIEKAGCYINDGKYGYFLTCNKKNYRLPEFLQENPEWVHLEMAQAIINYKNKASEGFYEFKKEQADKKNSESDTEKTEDIKIKKK
jgi:topoisomerase IA-like protein